MISDNIDFKLNELIDTSDEVIWPYIVPIINFDEQSLVAIYNWLVLHLDYDDWKMQWGYFEVVEFRFKNLQDKLLFALTWQ